MPTFASLPAAASIFLDANTLVYHASADPTYGPACKQLMERIGLQREGILRQHEVHNGTRQDVYFYGILKPEFYQLHQTIFKLAN